MLGKKAQQIFDQAMAQAATAPLPAAAPIAAGPSKYAGMNRDRTRMAVANIIADPDQPRKDFDEKELADLALTIGTHGVLEPVRLRWSQDKGFWIIVVGERRVRAARLAGLNEIPFVDDGERSRDELDEVQIIENIHKAGLKPSEIAEWIRRYMARVPGRTQKEIAARVRLSEATISNVLAASELPPPILKMVDAGMIPTRVGAELASIENEVEQARLAEMIVTQGLNREQAMAEVKENLPGKSTRKKRRKAKPKLIEKARFQVEDGCVWTFFSSTPVTDEDLYRSYKLLGEQIGANRQGREAA